MRIGIDVTNLYIAKAGIYYYTLNLVRHLLALDNEHEYVLLDYAPVRGDRSLPFDPQSLESDRAHWIEIRGPHRRTLSGWKYLDFFGGRFAARCVDKLLECPWRWLIAEATRRELQSTLNDVDVLHISGVNFLSLENTNLVATVHDISPILLPEFHTPENTDRFHRHIDYVQRHARAIITDSEHTKRDLVGILEVPEERIHVVHLAADPRYFPIPRDNRVADVVRKYGVSRPNYILHVGTLEPRKNLVRLIEAYADVLNRFRGEVPPLVLAGGKGWLYEKIFRRVEELRLERRVIFTGFVDDEDLPFLVNGALFFVYPSLYEGFGIPVLEAMACGIPVITSNTSSLPEVAKNAAILIDPTDTRALSYAITTLLEDDDRRAALHKAGLARAASFSWRRTAHETLAAYEYAAQ